MKIYNILIASDHAGYELKEKIIKYLEDKHISVKDYGTDSLEKVDYPDYAKKVTDGLREGEAPQAILICGTGIGMSIAANRNSDIRAALCTDAFMAERARAHNNANILILGAKIIDEKLAYEIVDKFLNTEFDGGYHIKRLEKIS